jgi:predicted ATPase
MGRGKRKASPGPYLLEVEYLRDRVPDERRYPYSLPVVRNLRKLAFHPRVTFLVGENGTGKSTLLEALAVSCDLNAEGGSRNFRFSTKESNSPLDTCLRVAKSLALAPDSFFLRAESFYNVATEIERMSRIEPGLLAAYGGQSLHERSHGEGFFALFENRLFGQGLYFMDEPEAALSPNRQLQFLVLLNDLCRQGSQFVIATHSPIIMAYPDAWIYTLSEVGIRRTRYEETEHYIVTRAFLNSPRSMLSELLDCDGTPTTDQGRQA